MDVLHYEGETTAITPIIPIILIALQSRHGQDYRDMNGYVPSD